MGLSLVQATAPIHPARSEPHSAGASCAVVGLFVLLLVAAHAADRLHLVWTGDPLIREQLSLTGSGVLARRWWTPLTYALVHYDHLHLALNAAAMALFGYGLGRDWPWRRVAFLTLASGLGGAALWWSVHHGQRATVIGSSAIASGYVAAFALARPGGGVPLLGTRWHFPRWLLLVPLLWVEGHGLWQETRHKVIPQAVSHSAHIGGIAAAALCAIPGAGRRRRPGADA